MAGLFYEAQVNLLVPGSDYVDLFVALRQALARGAPWTPELTESLMPRARS